MSATNHIVIVDDDSDIRALLSDYLHKQGYRVSAVGDGKALDLLLWRHPADLIVLDLMLPGEDGFSICRRLRANSNVPIVMLTARDEDVDQIVGFEVGADDYVRKPFNPRALLARIKAILRRAEQNHSGAAPERLRYSFGHWELDTIARTLNKNDGTTVDLNAAEFELLVLLLQEPQRIWSRLELSQVLHGRENDPFDRSIDVRVSRLRQKLGDAARSPTLIKTVYGGGYVIGVPVVTASI